MQTFGPEERGWVRRGQVGEPKERDAAELLGFGAGSRCLGRASGEQDVSALPGGLICFIFLM